MQMTRGEMNDLLAKFATQNPEYRDALRSDARAVVEKQFNMQVPDNVKIKVVEESADTVYVVLPHAVEQGAELSDADLEQVAGGAMVKEAKCDNAFLGTVVEVNTSLF
jgi:hypothetical protein